MSARVIGVGNRDRGDDGAGRAVARLLSTLDLPGCEIREAGGEATEILELLEDAEAVWLVDACQSGAKAGDIHRFDVRRAPLPEAAFGVSTHGFGVAQAIELARAFGILPGICTVFAIEGQTFAHGTGPSTRVMRAVETVAQTIEDEMRRALAAKLKD